MGHLVRVGLTGALLCLACGEPVPRDAGRVDAGLGDAGPGDAGPPSNVRLTAVTFNTGTTLGLDHGREPDDGYSREDAVISDTHYGDGLAWRSVIDDTLTFLTALQPDVVAFQEVFYSGECASIPSDAHPGFACEAWADGDATVAEVVLGAGYQVACHQDKPDKCIAVRRAFGTIRGCEDNLCLDHLDGARVPDCGGGSRVGRAVLDLTDGRSLTVVNVHGSSGVSAEDQACRVAQFNQVFVDLDLDGPGTEPGANGAANLILGDLNTDPARFESSDASAARFSELVEAGGYHFVTEVGRRATPTYALFNIDHQVSDALDGPCWAPGVTEARPAVSETIYFDHVPVVCELAGFLE
ncbi:MAG: hypothetical protein AB8I08_25470 [Sandaracinaceae bacterium]